MPGRLTTHVLDIMHGQPAAGMHVALYRIDGNVRTHVKAALTNNDGRLDAALLGDDAFQLGSYELVFAVAAYFAALGVSLSAPPFLADVPIRFALAEYAHYHVPLLVSPWAYSTYRGS
ncbi:hydroxyisourate hydrolase [Candidatus Gracilibacteria bacterium]|nr:hydroxyisourate hydrolase [Candidatus Gracilibacteria bacterium]